MACLKVDGKSKDKRLINIKFHFCLFVYLVIKVPFCLLNDAVLVEEIRQGRRI
jgi:hypothetical protein